MTPRTSQCVGLAAIAFVLLAASGDRGPEPPRNLVRNGDFERGKLAPARWEQPDGVRVSWSQGYGVDGTFGIRISMDKQTAFGYGQGYFSDPIPIAEDTEYRLTVDVRSDAPNAILFVKGFAKVKSEPRKAPRYREVYSKHKEAHFDRYLKEHTKTGQFVTQSFTFHPRHETFDVHHVRVWLYGYLKPGNLYFDNVRVEKAGAARTPRPRKMPTTQSIPTPPDPDGESSPPIYLDPKDLSR